MTQLTGESVVPPAPAPEHAPARNGDWRDPQQCPALLRFSRDSRGLWLALAVAVALRPVVMCAVPLIPEEAYYWLYAKHPQLSYYDHPPMVAWVIWLGTALLRDTELGVRAGAALLMVGASLLMYRLAMQWFDRTTALISAALLQVLPVYVGIGVVAPMDAALCFFWLLCLVGVSDALRRNGARGWYLAGAALGAAMLSKYSAIFLAAGVFLAVAGHRRWRGALKTVHPYLALLIAIAMFSPVVVWNGLYDWASFRFQFVERYARDQFNVRTPLLFLALQLLVLTPVLLAAIAMLLMRGIRRTRFSPGQWFAVACAAPGIAGAMWTSLRSGVHVNWTAPIVLSLVPASVALALAHDRLLARRSRAARESLAGAPSALTPWAGALRRTALICAVAMIGIFIYLLVLQPRVGWLSAFGPWHELATVVEEQEDRLEVLTGREPRIVAQGKYRLASVLAFYRMPIEADPSEVIPHTTSQWVFGREGLGFQYWSTQAEWTGSDVVYVAPADKGIENIAPWFDRVEIVDDPRLHGHRDYVVAIGHGLRSQAPAPASGGEER